MKNAHDQKRRNTSLTRTIDNFNYFVSVIADVAHDKSNHGNSDKIYIHSKESRFA